MVILDREKEYILIHSHGNDDGIFLTYHDTLEEARLELKEAYFDYTEGDQEHGSFDLDEACYHDRCGYDHMWLICKNEGRSFHE